LGSLISPILVEEGCAIDFACSGQASAEHFQQGAESPLLRNRGLGPLAVTVLPIPLASRGTATSCADGTLQGRAWRVGLSMGNALRSILTRLVACVAVAIAAGLLFLAGATVYELMWPRPVIPLAQMSNRGS
jgi:hypothetical protein